MWLLPSAMLLLPSRTEPTTRARLSFILRSAPSSWAVSSWPVTWMWARRSPRATCSAICTARRIGRTMPRLISQPSSIIAAPQAAIAATTMPLGGGRDRVAGGARGVRLVVDLVAHRGHVALEVLEVDQEGRQLGQGRVVVGESERDDGVGAVQVGEQRGAGVVHGRQRLGLQARGLELLHLLAQVLRVGGQFLAHRLRLGFVLLLAGQQRGQHVGAQRVVILVGAHLDHQRGAGVDDLARGVGQPHGRHVAGGADGADEHEAEAAHREQLVLDGELHGMSLWKIGCGAGGVRT